MSFWSEYGTFWKVSRRHFKTTGAVLPSSPFLARALARPLEQRFRSARILEVGPGTGAVTKAIVRRMITGDQLDAVELNEQFVDRLRHQLNHEPLFRSRSDQIHVIHKSVEQLPGEGVYDFIISGLPFNSFPSSLVRRIFRAYDRLLKPGGVMSYFEYVLIRQFQSPFVNSIERRRLYRVGKSVSKYVRAYQVRKERVFMNVPPAVVRHLRLKPASRKMEGVKG